MRKKYLITGGSGFFGSLLQHKLLQEGYACVNIDLEKDEQHHKNLTSIKGDIRDADLVERVFTEHGGFYGIFHLAAILAHAVKDETFLWESNVDGTKTIADACIRHGVKNLVFTSSNCLWGEPLGRPVTETDEPNPIEIYGRSKLAAEKILLKRKNKLHSTIIRCPTIMAAGRLGLLAILFEFIDENRKVWVVGGGENKYQFIYAPDLSNACIRAINRDKTEIYHIGSDDVRSFREVYDYVIKQSGSTARVAGLPKSPTLLAMRIAHKLGLSPLGPYQYKMIAEDFVFDTTKIKQELGWQPTLSNHEMMLESYKFYHDHRLNIENRKDVSAHKQGAKMGVIRLLKWLS
jgi:nucleoside-diphosphate-sugar epimerase